MPWKLNDFRASNFLEANTDTLAEHLSLANLAKWHLPSGKLLISRKFLENSSNGKELLQLLKNELPRAIERKPLKTLINQQTAFQLIKFIIGFDPKLSIKELNDFLRPLPKSTPKQIEKLDDFSWVALQNACLN